METGISLLGEELIDSIRVLLDIRDNGQTESNRLNASAKLIDLFVKLQTESFNIKHLQRVDCVLGLQEQSLGINGLATDNAKSLPFDSKDCGP